MDPIIGLGAFAGSLLLGLVKSTTGALDGKVGKIIKPFQPLAIAAASVGLPLLAASFGIVDPIDPAAFVQAPFATAAAISAREVLARVTRKK